MRAQLIASSLCLLEFKSMTRDRQLMLRKKAPEPDFFGLNGVGIH